MGRVDAETKRYMSDNERFADAFNFLIYGGEQVIKASELMPMEAEEIAIPFGDGKREPIERHRDILKLWAAKCDEKASYLLFGIEGQDRVHYAMPIRNMLYDALSYTRQVEATARSHRREERRSGRTVSPGEYLSGFYKDDKVMPVITLTIHFGPDHWDGPLSVHEMLGTRDEQLLAFVPNYHMNLIDPAGTEDADFERFQTGLREVLQFIKYSKDDEQLARIVLESTRFKSIDVDTASFIKTVTNSKIQLAQEEGRVNMCEALLEMQRKSEAKGLEQGLEKGREEGREKGREEGREQMLLESIANVVESLGVSAQRAMEVLKVPEADRPRYLAML